MIRLRAVPVTVVQNCTSLPLLLAPMGISEDVIPAESTCLASWQVSKQRPEKAVLLHTMKDGTRLSSQPFQLGDGDELLTLQCAHSGRVVCCTE